MIYIHTPLNSRYCGVYDDGGWRQSDTSNLPTNLAILDNIVNVAGNYTGIVVEDMSEIYAETTSVFDVTFTPTAPKRIDDMLHTQPITGLGKVKGYEFEYKKRILNQYRRHNAN